MKRLHFDYYMQIDYAEDVSKCNFTIKCIPKDTARQCIHNLQVELFPCTKYSTGIDGFYNQKIYGINEIPHKTFYFHLTGEAETGLEDYEEVEDESLSALFRHPFGRNRAGKKICAYHEQLGRAQSYDTWAGLTVLEKAEYIMQRLYQDFQYQQYTTTIQTSAEEAFELGHGVCQDYAHIFIALLHLEGIPARYVTGLLIGEGASHAWVEVLQDGKWYGLDPTNNVRVTENHIKIGVGREAGDCQINRGIMHGGGPQSQYIKVSVKKIGEE